MNKDPDYLRMILDEYRKYHSADALRTWTERMQAVVNGSVDWPHSEEVMLYCGRAADHALGIEPSLFGQGEWNEGHEEYCAEWVDIMRLCAAAWMNKDRLGFVHRDAIIRLMLLCAKIVDRQIAHLPPPLTPRSQSNGFTRPEFDRRPEGMQPSA